MTLPTAGITLDEFYEVFLEEDDFPEPLRMVQDNRDQGPDPGNIAFPKYHGLFSGFRVWVGSDERPLWRIVDARWAFPSAEKAQAFHLEQLQHNSEGHPLISEASAVGECCHVFGGTSPNPLIPTMSMTAYYYIFRVHNIVIKLFIAQGIKAVEQKLNVEDVAAIARRIESRINEKAY